MAHSSKTPGTFTESEPFNVEAFHELLRAWMEWVRPEHVTAKPSFVRTDDPEDDLGDYFDG